MTKNCCARRVAMALVLLMSASAASAQTTPSNSSGGEDYSHEAVFRKGWHEGTAGIGVLFSGISTGGRRPIVDYVTGYAQYGYMLSDIEGEGFLRGNFELSPEIFGSAIWKETGSYIVGFTIWGRFNFIQPGWRVVPFVHVGAGAVLTDVDHKYTGQDFNFNLEAGGGIRYFIKPKLSLNAEFRYQHISNANTGAHNVGINTIGPVLGVSWLF